MNYRTLGSSELQVAEISLGSWLTYAGGVGLEQTRACTDAAFDAGINFFDTANLYGQGAAEAAWGGSSPHDPATSTSWRPRSSSRCPTTPPIRACRPPRSTSRSTPRFQRLRTDHIDLYDAHRFDPDVPIEETLEALGEVMAAGKARYLGFSEWTVEQIHAAVEIVGAEFLVSSQPQYSMLWQAPEAELFDACTPLGISHVVWSPLAQGVLTGKYRPGQQPPADSRAASTADAESSMRGLVMNDATLQAVERLRPVAEQAGLSLSELALAWVLRRPEVASAITGASRPEQVHANAKASGITLSQDTLDAIDEALGDAPVTQPTLAPLARVGVTHR